MKETLLNENVFSFCSDRQNFFFSFVSIWLFVDQFYQPNPNHIMWFKIWLKSDFRKEFTVWRHRWLFFSGCDVSEKWALTCKMTGWHILVNRGERLFARVICVHDCVAVSPACEVMRSCCRCMYTSSYTSFKLWQWVWKEVQFSVFFFHWEWF